MRKPTRHMATTPEGLELVSSSFGRRANEGTRTYRPNRDSHLSTRGSHTPQEPPYYDEKDANGRNYSYRSLAGAVHELPEVSELYLLHFRCGRQ